ncbi:MAG: NHL repeat-containing protein [Candidatus Eiseniibacteriota bacterium]|nr:MAG: NHL repeat-containing protein [Candidatus Eisenbacteria bacterium]
MVVMRKRDVVLFSLVSAFCCLSVFSCSSQLARGPQGVASYVDCAPGAVYSFSFGSSGQSPGQFRSPSSVSIDSFGNLLIADTGNNRIQKFDSSGLFLSEFGGLGTGGGGLNGPTDAVENALSIYVVDSRNERVLEYDTEGRFLSVCLSADDLPDSRRGFGPRKLAFSGTGYAFLSDVEADAVVVLSRFWEPVSMVGGFGAAEGRFSDPLGLARGESEEILVCDTGNKRVQKLDSVGNPRGVLDFCSGRSLCEPVAVAVAPGGTFYLADAAARRVLVFDAAGTVKCELPGAKGPFLVSPSALAVSPKGLLYVVDGGADVVHVFKIHADARGSSSE